jgi:asparagine synthase (glutamine-hydrolysing)
MFFLGELQYDPEQGRMEKWVMRKAFDDEEQPYLPKV